MNTFSRGSQNKQLAAAALTLAIAACTCGPATTLTQSVEETVEAESQGAVDDIFSTLEADIDAGDFSSSGGIPLTPPAGNEGFSNFIGYAEGGLPVFEPPSSIEDVTSVQTMSIGATVNGTSESSFDAHHWLFEGVAGQQVTVTVASTDNSSDVELYVFDPVGNLLVNDLDDTSGGGQEQATVSLPTNGLYTVRVEFWSSGTYSVTVQ